MELTHFEKQKENSHTNGPLKGECYEIFDLRVVIMKLYWSHCIFSVLLIKLAILMCGDTSTSPFWGSNQKNDS